MHRKYIVHYFEIYSMAFYAKQYFTLYKSIIIFVFKHSRFKSNDCYTDPDCYTKILGLGRTLFYHSKIVPLVYCTIFYFEELNSGDNTDFIFMPTFRIGHKVKNFFSHKLKKKTFCLGNKNVVILMEFLFSVTRNAYFHILMCCN